MRRVLIAISLCAFLTGCMIGPNYKRPSLDVPAVYRDERQQEAFMQEGLGQLAWWQIFKDGQLQNLIRIALGRNYDVRIAAARILEAQAQLASAQSYELPAVNADAMVNPEHVEKTLSLPAYTTTLKEVDLSFNWTLDFWGKYRRMIEAARANVLASQWGKRAVIVSLVSQVAGAYFQLRELDEELAISKRSLKDNQKSLKLTQALHHYGSSPILDVYQAQQLVYTSTATIPDLERRIEQQENLISILIGNNPNPVERGWPQELTLSTSLAWPRVPVGLPSSLLERRPDIQEAEEQLVAANAQVGAAQASYFPQISLTGDGGFESSALADLFSGPAGMWSFAGNLTQPIFDAGRIRSAVKLAEAQKQEALLNYQKILQEAFREVSDDLIALRRYHEYRIQQELLTKATEKSARISNALYKGGETSYLQVLDSYTRFFSSELQLSQARLNELQGLVQLYQALGGGWIRWNQK